MKTLTEAIYSATTPFDNPYQGPQRRVLFVCAAGLLRSATMAAMYGMEFNTRACGVHPYALIRLSDNLVAWAETIVFVDQSCYQQAQQLYNFDLNNPNKYIVVLDIPDKYHRMSKDLQALIRQQEGKWQ